MSKKAATGAKPSVYQIVTDRIIASLKTGYPSVQRHSFARVRIPAEADQYSWMKPITIPV